MTVAILTAKRADISGIADLFAVDELIYIVMAAVVIVFGAGAVSLDSLVSHSLAKRGSGRLAQGKAP